MTISTFPVFINGSTVEASAGEKFSEVLVRYDPDLAAVLFDPSGVVTDARGLPLDPDAPVHGGAIYRVQKSARKGGLADA